jgi:dTDP-4-amino-4,6-dideoxygalactose transaminase
MMNDHVPFVDLNALHEPLHEELTAVFREALRTSRFIGGPPVEEFEREFAEFCGTRFCIGVGSGTDALRFALIAAGVKQGETVITVSNTFIATTEAISQAGAVPEFVDIDEQTYNMDAEKLREHLETRCIRDPKTGRPVQRQTGSRVTAVIPVHLYGQTADMDAIRELAEQYGLIVIEDACQAHGALYFSRRENRWGKAGSLGTAAAFSFYPGKNLGACGEAGAVTTDNERIARTVRMLRDHGQIEKYHHRIEGYNGRLDAIQAGILSAKLKHLPFWNELRRRCAQHYTYLLAGTEGIITPSEPAWSKSAYHLYVIRSADRDGLRQHLAGRQVETGLHYPLPLHLQEPYLYGGRKMWNLPRTERAAREILSLPLYPGLTAYQQKLVAEAIQGFRRTGAAAAMQSA